MTSKEEVERNILAHLALPKEKNAGIIPLPNKKRTEKKGYAA